MLTSRNLLLVEDSLALQKLICTQLKHEFNLQPVVCSSHLQLQSILSGQQEGVNASDIRLAISNIYLTDAPAGAAIHSLRQHNIPTIVATGRQASDIEHDLGIEHAGDCLIKDSSEFIHLLTRTLHHVMTLAGRKALIIGHSNEVLSMMRSALEMRLMDVYESDYSKPNLQTILSNHHLDVVLIELASDQHAQEHQELVQHIRTLSQNENAPLFGFIDRPDSKGAPLYLNYDLDDFIKLPAFAEELQWRIHKRVSEADKSEKLRETAIRDYLTGLYNRRHFFSEAEKRVKKANDEGRYLQVAMIDIDYFKKLNDTYGHEVGDVVLEAVAQRFNKMCGTRQLLARLGGEEFAILMDLDSMDDAEAFCEEVRLAICSKPISTADGPLNVSVSIGVANVCGNEDFINYITAADQYLYMAKHTGRNRTLAEERFEQTGT